jgi:hypothetical protein
MDRLAGPKRDHIFLFSRWPDFSQSPRHCAPLLPFPVWEESTE